MRGDQKPSKRKGKAEFTKPKPLDEEYLGQRLPGTPQQRVEFLHLLVRDLEDPAKGPEWVKAHCHLLLSDAKFIVENGGLDLSMS